MKKLFSLIAVLLSAAMLTAPLSAAAGDDAYKLYTTAMKKLDALSSVEMRVSDSYKLSMGSSSFETKETGTLKQRYDDQGRLQMSLVMSDDEDVTSKYYRGNYVYEEYYSYKYAMRTKKSQALYEFDSLHRTLTQAQMKNVSVSKAEGGTQLQFSVDPQVLDKLSGGYYYDDDLYDELGITMADTVYTMIIGSDGMLTQYRVTEVMTMKDEDFSAKITYSRTYKITSTNSTRVIDFPSDLASYSKY